jgi:hypothetical protein
MYSTLLRIYYLFIHWERKWKHTLIIKGVESDPFYY